MQYNSQVPLSPVGAAMRPPSAFGIPREGTTPVSSAPPSGPSSQRILGAGQLPAFQPAPSQPRTMPMSSFPVHEAQFQEDYPTKPAKSETRGGISVGSFLTLIGAFLLILVVLTPVWDSVRLLYDSTFVYFLGRWQPFWVLVFCGGTVVFFMIAMMLVMRCARQEMKTEQTFMFLFTSILTTLGLGLLLFSVPLNTSTAAAYRDLMVHCSTSVSTEPLYAYYNVLLNIRQKPDCINQVSVEQCDGFQERYPYTGFLKHMESQYMCSGFCYTAGNTSSAYNTSQPLAAVLLEEAGEDTVAFLQSAEVLPVKDAEDTEGVQMSLVEALQRRTAQKSRRSGRYQKRHDTQGVFLLSANQTLSKVVPMWDKLPQGPGNTVNNMAATGWMQAYPPTLFTNANFKTSCEGAAARDLRFTAGETANLMYIEGTALLIASVIIGFLKICSMCRTRQEQLEETSAEANLDGDGQYQSYAKKVVL